MTEGSSDSEINLNDKRLGFRRRIRRGRGKAVSCVNFIITFPKEPSIHSSLPPMKRILRLLEVIGESITDAMFVVLDAAARPVLINNYALQHIPDTKNVTSDWFNALVPAVNKEEVWAAWVRNSNGALARWEQTGQVGVMVYNPAMLITTTGVTQLCSTQAFLVDPETRTFCGFVHILREQELGEDPRVVELVEELQNQLRC